MMAVYGAQQQLGEAFRCRIVFGVIVRDLDFYIEQKNAAADIREAFAGLVHIEEPRRPPPGSTCHHLHQVMDAFCVDGGFPMGARDELTEDAFVIDELPLQDGSDFVTLPS